MNKVLSKAQEEAEWRREIARVRSKPTDWQTAYDTMPSGWRDRKMVDSSMTLMEINSRAQRYLEEFVPFEWREAICMCVGPGHYGADGNVLATCKKCGKIARHRFRKCYGCKKQYVTQDFQHHLFDLKEHDNLIIGNYGHRFWRIDEDTSVRLAGYCFDCLNKFCNSSSVDVPPPVRTVEMRSLDEILSAGLEDEIPVFKL